MISLAIKGAKTIAKNKDKIKKYLKSKKKKNEVGDFKGRSTPKKDMEKPLKKDKDGKLYSVMGKDKVAKYKRTQQIKGGAKTAAATAAIEAATSKKSSEFEKAFSKAHNEGKKTFTFKGKSYSTKVKKG